MMGATKLQKSKPVQKAKAKGRKIGRHRDRSPSAKAYKAGNRCEINKRKRAKRHLRRMEKKAAHLEQRAMRATVRV